MEKFKAYFSGKTKEDVFKLSKDAVKVRRALGHWNGQHDYVGVSWDGVVDICRAIRKAAKQAHIESAGWYLYPTSTKTGKDGSMDGKDWRYVLPEFDPVVVVNCHSCINEHIWTLNTTVFNSKEIDRSKLDVISDDDAEACAIRWAIKTARILETDGYTYSKAIELMTDQLKKTLESK